MTKSSINIQPVKSNSEAHNLRKVKLDYTFPHHSSKNKSLILEKIHPGRKRLELLVKEKTGRAMQKKATPIREGVVIVGKKNTFEDLKKMCNNIEQELGIKTMQIHLHEDEGHQDRNSGEFKQNRHAHIVFNWINEETGKSVKLNKQHMAQMQTIVAESLGLQRGQSSEKKHLHSMEFKAQAEAKAAKEMEEVRKQAKQAYFKMKAKHAAVNYSFELIKGVSETFKRLGGIHEAKRLKVFLGAEINGLKNKNKDLTEVVSNSVSLEKHNALQQETQRLKNEIQQARKIIKDLQDKYNQSINILKEITLKGNKILFESAKEMFEEQKQTKEQKPKKFKDIKKSQKLKL